MSTPDNDASPTGPVDVAALLDAVPVQSWDVRRRRYGEGRWLVRHNEVFELGPVADAAWRACGDGRRVVAVARAVAEDLGLAPADALEPTITALLALHDAGLLHLTPST